jgi:hypothetical protein
MSNEIWKIFAGYRWRFRSSTEQKDRQECLSYKCWKPARALPFACGLPSYRTTARLADPVTQTVSLRRRVFSNDRASAGIAYPSHETQGFCGFALIGAKCENVPQPKVNDVGLSGVLLARYRARKHLASSAGVLLCAHLADLDSPHFLPDCECFQTCPQRQRRTPC